MVPDDFYAVGRIRVVDEEGRSRKESEGFAVGSWGLLQLHRGRVTFAQPELCLTGPATQEASSNTGISKVVFDDSLAPLISALHQDFSFSFPGELFLLDGKLQP